MKIVWVTPWFGNYRVPVYEELNKLCHGDFHLICSKEETRDLVRDKLTKKLGDNVVILDGQKEITFGDFSSDFANSALILKRQPGLYDAIKKTDADVVITEGFGGWAPTAILYALLHRKKLCMFYERTAYVERNCPLWRRLYRRLIGAWTSCFLVNGSLTVEYLNEKLFFRKKHKIEGCMSADSYELASAVSRFKDNEKTALVNDLRLGNGLTFLFVGQMVQRKGIVELLKAWERHIEKFPQDNLLVIGTGILLDSLKQQYANTHSVHILGGISYDQIYKYYALCDVFVMPTLEDNWCLVVPEAMACSKPIACSIYNGGHKELIKEGVNGFTFDPLKPESIIETLAKYHGADLELMGTQSRSIESNFSPDKAAGRIYEACLSVYNGKH